MTDQDYWNVVNNCSTNAEIAEAEKALNESNLDNLTYNDMMMALSQISRELYR